MRLQQLPKTSGVDCFADMARHCVPRRRAGVRECPLPELGPYPQYREVVSMSMPFPVFAPEH